MKEGMAQTVHRRTAWCAMVLLLCGLWGSAIQGLDLVSVPIVNSFVGSDSYSDFPQTSANGRYVVFMSAANNWVTGNSLGYFAYQTGIYNIYRTDLTTGETILVSVSSDGTIGANNYCSSPSISADGTRIAFYSAATNLVSNGQVVGYGDVYVRDVNAGTTTWVSQPYGGGAEVNGSQSPCISADGTAVAYISEADNLIGPADTSLAQQNVYVTVLATGATTLASVSSDGTTGGNSWSSSPSISADGSRIAFFSYSANIVAGPSGSFAEVYVRDLNAGTTSWVSQPYGGAAEAGGAQSPSISSDGTTVVYMGYGGNLTPSANGLSGTWNIYATTLASGSTVLVSVSVDGTTGGNNASECLNASISGDGTRVVFWSYATNLVSNGPIVEYGDIYVRDLTAGTTSWVSVPVLGFTEINGSFSPSISSDGSFAVFSSLDYNLVASKPTLGLPNIYAANLTTGMITLVMPPPSSQAEGSSFYSSISADGTRIAFISYASNLATTGPNVANNQGNVYLADLSAGTITLVSLSNDGMSAANGGCYMPSISADGTKVAYYSNATNLGQPGINYTNAENIFYSDLTAGTTTLVSMSANNLMSADNSSSQPSLSADGMHVAFFSYATDLVADGPQYPVGDVYVWDAAAGATTWISQSNGVGGNEYSNAPSISADGSSVAFASGSTNLLSNGAVGNVTDNILLANRTTAAITLVSAPDDGSAGANGNCWNPSISADGSRVAYQSSATNLAGAYESTNGNTQIYVTDLGAEATTLVSVSSDGTSGGSGYSSSPVISANGQRVAFASTATNLVANGPANGQPDIYVRDLGAAMTSWVSVAPGGSAPNSYCDLPSLSANGQFISFDSPATNLSADSQTGLSAVYRVSLAPLIQPQIVWATPAPIVYGSALSVAQLGAVAVLPNTATPIAGTFSYTPALGAILPVPGQTLTVTFAPTDAVHYGTATASVTLAVTPAMLTVTAVNRSKPYDGLTSTDFTGLTGTINDLVPNLWVSYAGWANGDSPQVLNGTLTLTRQGSNATAEDVGSYPVLPGGLSAANYSITYLPGTLTIAPALAAVGYPGLVQTWGNANTGFVTTSPSLNGPFTVGVSVQHALALQSDGSVVGWGDNTYGENVPPAGVANVVAIGAGNGYSAALLSNGSVVTWGYDANGVVSGLPPSAQSGVTAISAGELHMLALRSDGTVIGWGYNGSGEAAGQTPPAGTTFTAIAAGTDHSVALTSAGTLVAWGADGSHQCDIPSDLSGVTAIAAGAFHTVALLSNGTVQAWGDDSVHQCDVPPNLTGVIAIAAGFYHTLALTNTGTVVSWGDDSFGQCSGPASQTGVSAISAGGTSSGTITQVALSYTGLPQTLPVVTVPNALAVATTYSGSSSAPANAGTYIVSSTIAAINNAIDYQAPPAIAPLTIAPAPLTIVADSLTVDWNYPIPPLTFSANGYLNGDTAATAFTSPPLLSVGSVTQGTHEGIYPIIISGGTAPNYILSYGSGTLGIGLNFNYSITEYNSIDPALTGTATVLEGYTYFQYWQFLWNNGYNQFPGSYTDSFNYTAYDNYEPSLFAYYFVGNDYFSNGDYDTYYYPSVIGNSNGNVTILSEQYGSYVYFYAQSNSSYTLPQNAPAFLWQFNVDTLIGTIPLNGANNAEMAVTANSNRVINLYVDAAGNVHGTLLPRDPGLAWSTPSSIVYGTPLSALQNATANVSGQFTYTPGLSTILTAGPQTISVTFTADDAADYQSPTVTNTIVVQQAVPSTAWTPAPLTSVTPLGAAQLNATASVPGIFNYSQQPGQTLPVGTQLLTATFQPADTVDYAAVSASAFVVVTNGVPIISWNPSGTTIRYGKYLSSGQLDATVTVGGASLPGVFTYTPPLGTYLHVGANQVLTVSFAPTDAVDYSTATATTQVTVTPSPLTIVANSFTIPVGAPLPTYTASYASLVAQDTPASLTTAPTLACAAKNSLTIATYPITASGAVDNDYTITYTAGTLAVTAPANDNFANATVLSGLTAAVVTYNRGASLEAGEPEILGLTGGRSLWWSWTAPQNGLVIINTLGSTFDTLLAVYTGTSVASLTIVQDNDNFGGTSQSQVTFPAVAGTTYMIVVDGKNAAYGTLDLNLNQLPYPANDAFANAVPLQGNAGQLTGSTVGATKEIGEPSHAGIAGGASIWYSFAAPAGGGLLEVDTFGSAFDTLLGIYTGTAVSELTTIASNDNAGATVQSQVKIWVPGGVTYAIAVDGKSGKTGAVTLNWNFTPAPANDDFAAASVLSGASGSVSGTNVAASRETGEPKIAGNAGGASVWYSWTAPAGGGLLTVATEGSSFDTLLGLYTGASVSTLTLVTKGSDDNVSASDLTSAVTIRVVGGTTYAISVDGKNGVSGTIALAWSLVPTPTNDAFANALPLPGVNGTLTGTNAAATKETGEPTIAGNAGGVSVWYRWTAPEGGGLLTIATEGSGFDTLLGVYAGSAVSALTLVKNGSNDNVSASDLSSAVTVLVATGSTYWISVDGKGGATGTVVLTWSLTPAPLNDDIANAATFFSSWTGNLAATNIAASKEPGEPNHAGNAGGASVWWTFTAAQNGTITLSTAGSTFDTLLAAYSGYAGTLASLVAVKSDDNVSTTDLQSQVNFHVTAGTSYWIAVDGKAGAEGAIALSWNFLPNDALADALILPTPQGTLTASNVDATKESGEPNHAGNAGGASIWWVYTVPASGYLEIDTIGSNFDTLLAVYTQRKGGTGPSTLIPVASNDDISSTVEQSQVDFKVTAGTTYYIAVDGYADAQGVILLNWEFIPAGGG